MKKDFFEIMKNYNPDIKSFSVSSENIKEKAMQKIGKSEEKKKFDFRRVFTSIPAIVAVGLMVGTGVIAYELSTLDRAENFFENYNGTDEEFDENDRVALNSVFKPEITFAESNGTTIELTGNIYDENVAYFFFTLTAPEGTVLDEESYFFETFDLSRNTNSAFGGTGAHYEFNDDNLTDNITYFTISMHSNGYSIQDYYEITLGAMYSWGEKAEDGDLILEGNWTIPLKSDVYAESIEVLDEPFRLYTDTRYYRIDNIKISPISILVYASFETSYDDVNVSLIMKDGSVYDAIDFGHGGAVAFSGQYTTSYALGKPIDLSNVKSIKLNDTEISVEDKYAEKYGNVTEATEPDTTGMTEIYAGSSYIPTTETEDIVRLKSIKIDNENIAIALTSNAIQDTMTIITKDNQTELIPFGNGTDADGDGIYTEIHKLRNEYNPEDILFIEIENAGVRFEVAEYVKEKYENVTEATEPDTTGMTEIYAEKINIFETDDMILLDSIKMDHEKLIIALTSNTLQDTMTIHMKDKTKSEKILFGNGIDTNGDGIYTEAYYFDKPLNPEDVDYIEIENTGLRLEVSAYMNNN